MLFLYKTEVIGIHEKLIEEFGGIHGLRDEGALKGQAKDMMLFNQLLMR